MGCQRSTQSASGKVRALCTALTSRPRKAPFTHPLPHVCRLAQCLMSGALTPSPGSGEMPKAEAATVMPYAYVPSPLCPCSAPPLSFPCLTGPSGLFLCSLRHRPQVVSHHSYASYTRDTGLGQSAVPVYPRILLPQVSPRGPALCPCPGTACLTVPNCGSKTFMVTI